MSLQDKYRAVLQLGENLGVNTGQLKDPDLIKPGQELVIPNL